MYKEVKLQNGKSRFMWASEAKPQDEKSYIGIGGKARKVKKMYIGVGGKARLCYSAEADNSAWQHR